MKHLDTHAWCPSCKENSAIDAKLRCLWCGGETRRTRPGKPRGKYATLTDAQLRVLYRHHLAGRSIRELGDGIYRRAGFASGHSAAEAISDGFKRLGLQARSREEATALANRARGYEDSPGTEDQATYRRWLRRKNGRARRCKGLKTQAPGKGTQCTKWAAPGSDFCRYHDPAKRAEVLEAAKVLGAAA